MLILIKRVNQNIIIDVALLVLTDNVHNRLSGPATVEILKKEYKTLERQEYRNISSISSPHIYNLRSTRQYESHSSLVTPPPNNIGRIVIIFFNLY